MPVPKSLPKSPFDLIDPKDRWKPDLNSAKINIQHHNAPFIEKIRKEVYEWRQFGYDGVSDTSQSLLNYWFNNTHQNGFEYYFSQREAVESVIYLFERESVRSNNELLKYDSWGTLSEDSILDKWLRFVIKAATGSGKTKIISLIMAWSYFHKQYEVDSILSKNFLLVAPNTIVLDRLQTDFLGLKIFNDDPVLPPAGYNNRNWNMTLNVHIQDNIGSISDLGNIFLTNIQRFRTSSEKVNEDDLKDQFLGLNPVKSTTDNKIKVKDIIRDLDDLIVLNDEAHHIHEENAWKRTIEDIDNHFIQKGKKLVLQIDVTATPKHKKGEIFLQTISDYPLVEAIHQDVVKTPVIPDEPSRKKLKENSSAIFSEKYRDYINLGVETWEKQYKKHQKLNQKALLFIMVDDTKNCDDVEKYLQSTYPLLKGNATFSIHTKDNTKDKTGFINENTPKGKEELARLRRLVNTVDNPTSPVKAIVSVLMLKEGWDVKNITTIVGLRAYSSHILPEQTLGRGLRRMYFGQNIDEELDVIGTDNFIDYVKTIKIEGVEIEEIPVGGPNPPSGPNIIEVDSSKDIESLDITIPDILNRFESDFLKLYELNVKDIKFTPIKIKKYSSDEKNKEIIFRETIDDREVKRILFDSFKSLDSTSIIKFYTESVLRELHMLNIGISNFIYEKIEIFIKDYLFGKKVDISNKDIIRNLSETTTTQLIINLFKQEINKLVLTDIGFRQSNSQSSVADTKPYPVSRKKPVYVPKKSVFNIMCGDSNFEIEFAKFLDNSNDVISFFKNDLALKNYINYIKHDGSSGIYYPDFYIKLENNDRWVVEVKGASELNARRKYDRLKIWCEDASKSHSLKWDCLFIRQEIWNNFSSQPNSFEDLVNLIEHQQVI